MRKCLIALLFPIAALGQVINNPGITPSQSLTPGNCVQATGASTVATTAAPCGSGSGGTGNVTGPGSSTTNDIAAFSNGTGTGILDTGVNYTHVAQTGVSNPFALPNTFANGASVPGTLPSITIQNTPNTAALLFLPDLAAGDYDPISQAGDAGIIDGTANNTNFGITMGLWATGTSTGFRIAANGVSFPQRPTFNGNTPWDSGNLTPSNYALLSGANFFGTVTFGDGAEVSNYNSLNVPVINLVGNPPVSDPINGIYYSGNPIFYIIPNDGTWVNGDGNELHLTSDVGGDAPGCIVATSGLLSCSAGLTIAGTTTLQGTSVAVTQAVGDNSNSIATDAFVQSALGGGNSSPTFTNALITGNLTVDGISYLGSGVTVSNSAVNSTIPFDATTFNATGTGVGQGIADSGPLTVAGPTILGNSSSSSTTILGTVTIGQGATSGSLTVLDGITTPALNPSGTTPTFTLGPGAGTGGSASVAGSAMSGSFNVTTGNNPGAGGTLITLTATNTSFASVPFCIVSSGSASTAILYTTPSLNNGTLTLSFSLANNEQLASSTGYTWNYWCP